MSAHEAQGSLDTYLNELEDAISGGDLATLKDVIDRHTESRLRDEVLADALVISCDQGHPEAVQHLVAEENAKADSISKNVRQGKNTPPLVLAVKYCEAFFHQKPTGRVYDECQLEPAKSNQSLNGFKILDTLLRHGVSISGCGPDNKNALSHVLRIEVAELLLAERGESERRRALEHRDGEGNDALMSAIINTCCNEAVALKYIECGANKDTVDNEGRTTLMNAAWRQRTQLVELLLKDASIVGKTDGKERNIWHHIASDHDRTQSDDITKLLFATKEADAIVNAIDNQGQTPLHMSALFGKFFIADGLLKKTDIDLEAIEAHAGKTALHFAAAKGDVGFIKALLERGADRFAICKGGLIPLHLVCGCMSDAVNAAELLMEHEAEKQLKFRTEENETPLHIAAAHGNEAIVNSILGARCDVDIDAGCDGGWTALHLACGRHTSTNRDSTRRSSAATQQLLSPEKHATDSAPRYLAVVRALLTAGAKVDTKSRLSRTALHIAAEMGHVEIVELLLQQRNVQFAARDSRGNTPLIDAARSTERQRILQLLAPWSDLFIQSLPPNVEQAAQRYDANIIDFQKNAGPKMLRRKIPVSDLLYKGCGEAGSLSHNHVSTRPDPEKEGAFRWIHLPANNLHWAQALLTKHFIEGSVDVESFRALERSLSQQQYRGRRIHSRFMRPACNRLVRRLGDHGHVNHPPAHDSADNSPIVDLKGRGRMNSADVAEVAENKTAPPSPKGYMDSAVRDFSGLRIKLEPQMIEDPQTHERTTKPLRLKIRAPPPIGNMSAVMESGQASVAFPERKTSPTIEKSSEAQELGAYLFMPYLTLENKDKVRIMHDQLRNDHRSPPTGNVQTESTDSSSNDRSSPGRDQKLHQAYAQWKKNDYCLHVRRTLDQFWYRNVDTAVRDGDQVVQRYQAKEKTPTSEIDSLMVDQLWVWVLGPSLIVTSFPQNWQHPRGEVPDLLGSILEEIDPRNGTPVQSVYELATCIVGHCLSSCDQTADNTKQESRSSVLEMFGSSVGDAMNQEVILFSRFQKASEIASEWVQALSDIKQDAEEAQRKLERKYLSKTGEDASRSTITGEPIFIEVLLNIHTETKLLEEVKDIQDELGILLQVVDDQQGVHKDICATFRPLLRTEGGPYQARSSGILDEQNMLLEQQKAEIENMLKQVKSTYKSITDLLDLKQKQANVFEARAARKLAVETARAGGTLMVFTIVTVIFLPLSFLAAFFAIVLEGLPYNDDDRLPLNFILKYVVGVGLSTALAFVLMAWHHHSAVRWYQNAVRWSQGKAAKAKPLKNAARGMWFLIFIRWLKFIFEWKARRRDARFRSGSDESSRGAHGSDRTKASPASSGTVRERRPNLHEDLEKGRD